MAKKIKATKARSGVVTGQKNSNRQQMYLLGAVIAAVILVLVAVILINKKSAGTTEALNENLTYAGIPISGKYADVRLVDRASDVAETVSMGMNDEGIPYIGNLDAAITIAELADYTCPHCADFAPTMEKLVKDFARSGDALFEYYPVDAQSRAPQSTYAARASLCAGQQGGFWEMHDEIFRIHRAESYSAYTPTRLGQAAEDIGLDSDQLRACMNTNEVDAGLVTTQRLASDYNATSTPTVLYKLRGEDRWNTLPTGDGEIGGGRPYEQLAQLIRDANATENSGG